MAVGFRGKVVGMLLILIGAWPFLLKIEQVGKFFSEYKILEYLVPGEIVYQAILILFGVMLLWRVRVVAEPIDYNSRRRR
jgi:hypothetical protein